MAPALRPQTRSALLLAALGLALVGGGDSAARKFQMSGTWAMRRGQIFWPLQFAQTAMGGQSTNTSQGSLSKAFGFPHGPVPGLGRVTATGSAPATLRVPPHRFVTQLLGNFPPGPSLVQLATSVSADGPAAAATLAPGDGPGSFTWCPGDAACAPTGPPQGAGLRNGRVVYQAGANRFGGVMQMLLGGGGTTSFLFDSAPFRVRHAFFGPKETQHTGGPYSFMHTTHQPAGVVTEPTSVPGTYPLLILHPGPRVTTMLGLTASGTGPALTTSGATTRNTGFPFTTGTVFAQQTTGSGGDDFFSVMGSDMRTALGAGRLSLVAGGLSLRTTSRGSSSSASFGKVWMTLSPSVPSLSPAGLAAATLLLMLAVGYALRGRR